MPIKQPGEELMTGRDNPKLVAAVTVPVPIATSYFQYDQQGVVFNMWYFGWFDDAMTQFLGEIGYPYTALNADGLDVQLVHTEADWRDAVRYGEQVVIDVGTERIGSPTFPPSFLGGGGGAGAL